MNFIVITVHIILFALSELAACLLVYKNSITQNKTARPQIVNRNNWQRIVAE